MDKAPYVTGKTGTLRFLPYCPDKDGNIIPRPKSAEPRSIGKSVVKKRKNGEVYIVGATGTVTFRPYVQEKYSVDVKEEPRKKRTVMKEESSSDEDDEVGTSSEDDTPLSLKKKSSEATSSEVSHE